MVVLASLAAAAWAYLLLFHGGFWRTDQRLPAAPAPATWPAVAVVVPARDEAAILPETLPTLLGQSYDGPLTVVLADDDSTDGTSDVASALGGPLRVVKVGDRPPGWAGKVRAMSRGLEEAPPSEFVLFADADIAFAPGTPARLVAVAEDGGYALVSQMALLTATTFWERVVVPAFVYFFAQLYPFRRVNRGRRTAAAAGGCMLVRRSALARAGGLAEIRGALIDDVSLGRLLKRSGGRCRLDLTTDVVSRRPYPDLASLWNMIARSAYTQLRHSVALLAGTVVGLVLLYALPPVAAVAGLVSGSAALAAAGLAGWLIMTATYVPMLRLYGLSVLRAPTLPLIALLYAAMTVDSARRHWLGRGGVWKGRSA